VEKKKSSDFSGKTRKSRKKIKVKLKNFSVACFCLQCIHFKEKRLQSEKDLKLNNFWGALMYF
jgi:hypothetical protein